MTDEAYQAALARLQRLAKGEPIHLVYPEWPPDSSGDRLLVFEAERDRTPATLEWLLAIGLELIKEPPGLDDKFRINGAAVIYVDADTKALTLDCDMWSKKQPTRGDVRTALWLFVHSEGD